MPSDHIAAAAFASAVLIRRDAKPATCVAVGLVSHWMLDAIPHLEPSFFGGVGFYMRFGTKEFNWTVVDHFIALAIALYALGKYAVLRDKRFPIFCFFAWAPDLIEPARRWFGPGMDTLTTLHSWPHLWWRPLLNVQPGVFAPLPAWIIGGITMIALWCLPLMMLNRISGRSAVYRQPAAEFSSP
ncbi:MAG TPA: hypothetical protein VF974_06385 [Patescibacteria group bacterium]